MNVLDEVQLVEHQRDECHHALRVACSHEPRGPASLRCASHDPLSQILTGLFLPELSCSVHCTKACFRHGEVTAHTQSNARQRASQQLAAQRRGENLPRELSRATYGINSVRLGLSKNSLQLSAMSASSSLPPAFGPCAQKWIGWLGIWNSTIATVWVVWANTAATIRSSEVILGGVAPLLPPVMYLRARGDRRKQRNRG